MKNERKTTFLLITIPILALFVCRKYAPLKKLFARILLFNASAKIRLITLTTIVVTTASLNVNRYDLPTRASVNKSM